MGPIDGAPIDGAPIDGPMDGAPIEGPVDGQKAGAVRGSKESKESREPGVGSGEPEARRMRRGGARGGRVAEGGLCASVLLGMAASMAWAQVQTPERCSLANLSPLYQKAFDACVASEGAATDSCCFAVSRFSANPPDTVDDFDSKIGANCLCFQDVYDNLKALAGAQDIKTFQIDDVVTGCKANFGITVGTVANNCAGVDPVAQPDPQPEPQPQPGPEAQPGPFMPCGGMRKKACRKTTNGNCFFFRKQCRATLRNGANPDDCYLLSQKPKICRAAGCFFSGSKSQGSCEAPPTAASRSLVNP